MSRRWSIDFETYSAVDLRTAGAFRYAEDPSTEALILAFSDGSFDPIAVDLTQPGAFKKLAPLFDAVERRETISAHNVQFERLIWTKVCKFPVTPQPHQWDCTAARARMIAIPGSLEGSAKALGLEFHKDPRGLELINLFSKPDKKGRRRLPADYPAEFKAFMEYCQQDVRVEMSLAKVLPPLSSVEKDAFLLDYTINDRGLPVNMDLVRKADGFVEEYSAELLKHAEAIAGCRPSQRVKTLDYLKSRGFELPNLQAATVEAFAAQPGIPQDLVDLMTYRIELSRAGTKKLKAIQNTVSADGRVRGGFLFSAATTRRWSSTGVQLHNLQKPSGETNPEVALSLIEDDPNDLRIMFNRPLSVIAESIRGFFESPKHFLIADYSSVEPRGLAWMVHEEWLLNAYHRKQDAYKVTAGKLYGIPASEVNDSQRFMGKQLVLGCFSADTLVLTDSGWKKIIDVGTSDRLWDGVEFVHHDGVIYQGEQETIDLCGVQVTPDHKILSGQQWYNAIQLKGDHPENTRLLELALQSANLPSKLIGSGNGGEFHDMNASVPAGPGYISEQRTSLGSLHDVPDVGAEPERSSNGEDTLNRPHLHPGNLSRRTTSGPEGSSEICTTESRAYTGGRDELTTTPSEGLRSVSDGNTSPTSLKMSSSFLDGERRDSSSTESTTSETMHQITADSSLTESPSLTRRKVYDILNSGPRTRFCVLSDRGPLIVHNCGYGMGVNRFMETVAKFGRQLTEEEAQSAVQGYRQSVPQITKFWRDIERTCIRAVRDWRTIHLGRLVIRPETLANGFRILFIDMPSGTIAYPNPSLGSEEWNGYIRDTFEFYVPLGSGWVKTDTFGGSLTENVIQALTRDVLRDGLVAADKAGFQIVGHVHDEAIAEGDNNPDDLREFERILCESSPWAEGFPLASEGYIAKRYRK